MFNCNICKHSAVVEKKDDKFIWITKDRTELMPHLEGYHADQLGITLSKILRRKENYDKTPQEITNVLIRQMFTVEFPIADKVLRVTMPDKSEWDVPVNVIAKHQAEHYIERGEYNDLETALNEEIYPRYEEDNYALEDWAENNMDWEDVKEHAKLVLKCEDMDYDDGWVNGEKEIV